MKGINIKVIPHSQQRYPTAGDWFYARDNTWEIRVSDTGNWRYNFLVAIHEIVEMAWCHYNGVNLVDVDEFDFAFEESRPVGDESEPGDDIRAPYYWGHQCATGIERLAAVFLAVNWFDYEQAIINL